MPDTFRIMGIDPGSYTTGIALVEVDLKTFKPVSIETTLIDVTDIIDKSTFKNHVYIRLMELTKRTKSVMDFYCPDVVAVEAGFINRFMPQAYGLLSKTMYAIVMGIMHHNHLMNIEELAPKTAKKAIGVTNQNKKETTLEALLKKEEITSLIDISTISEHEVDAISLCYPLMHKFKGCAIIPLK